MGEYCMELTQRELGKMCFGMVEERKHQEAYSLETLACLSGKKSMDGIETVEAEVDEMEKIVATRKRS